MTWIVLSVITAFLVSSQEAWVKKHFSHYSLYDMAAYPLAYSCPIFMVAASLTPVPALQKGFWLYFIISVPINGVAFLLYFKAIQVSPLSLTIPYLAFTPVFLILPGYLFLDEIPNIWGSAGIVTTCVGAYILQLDPDNRSFWEPFRAIFRETGAWIMLLVSFIFSICATIGKKSILLSSPMFYTMLFFAVHNLCVCLFLMAMGKVQMTTLSQNRVKATIAGLLLFFHALFHGWAISLAKAAYMISVKRLSVLFGIIYGGLLFKESNIRIRLIGGILMMFGAVLITLKGK